MQHIILSIIYDYHKTKQNQHNNQFIEKKIGIDGLYVYEFKSHLCKGNTRCAATNSLLVSVFLKLYQIILF